MSVGQLITFELELLEMSNIVSCSCPHDSIYYDMCEFTASTRKKAALAKELLRASHTFFLNVMFLLPLLAMRIHFHFKSGSLAHDLSLVMKEPAEGLH